MIKDGLTIDFNGTKHWYNKNGRHHRLDGPAYIGINGTKSWWIYGIRHRKDGPAYIGFDGYKEWWYEGEKLVITSEVISELLEVIVG